jgi:RHS repeat-associated protein
MTSRLSQTGNTDNKYRYNGKEFQDDLIGDVSLGLYDYGARFYDPQIGRWHVMDAMMESVPTITPYNYCFNNPIRLLDQNGMWTESANGGLITFDPQEIANFLNALKANAKTNVAKAITTSADYAYKVYNDLSKVGTEHPSLSEDANFVLSLTSYVVDAVTESNPEKMGWGDLTNTWLFELGNYNADENPIRFGANAKTTKDLKKQEGVLLARKKAIAAAQDGKPSVFYEWR